MQPNESCKESDSQKKQANILSESSCDQDLIGRVFPEYMVQHNVCKVWGCKHITGRAAGDIASTSNNLRGLGQSRCSSTHISLQASVKWLARWLIHIYFLHEKGILAMSSFYHVVPHWRVFNCSWRTGVCLYAISMCHTREVKHRNSLDVH